MVSNLSSGQILRRSLHKNLVYCKLKTSFSNCCCFAKLAHQIQIGIYFAIWKHIACKIKLLELSGFYFEPSMSLRTAPIFARCHSEPMRNLWYSYAVRSIDMSIKEVKDKVGQKRTKWDEAISDAKRKIKGLQYTIAVYRERKKSGDPLA